MDGISNVKGIGARIVLKGPSDIVIEHVLKFKLTPNNNQEKNKALIVGMILTLEMGATILKVKSNS